MATQENKERALLNAFGQTLSNNPTALRECMNLLKLYNLDAETLYSKWEAYIINKDEDSMTQVHLEEFKNYLRRILEQAQQRTLQAQITSNKANIRRQHGSGIPTSMNFVADRDHSSDFGSSAGTSAFKLPSTQPSAASKQFALRKGVGAMGEEDSLNKELSLHEETPAQEQRGQHTAEDLVNLELNDYRYMFEKITEKGEALNDRIEDFARMYKQSFPDTNFSNPSDPSQAIVTVIGRICSDANEGKANERSLVLETSREKGGRSRVRLDLTEVTEFSFFPGQIVVLSGINAHGMVFAVTRVHELPLLPMANSSPLDLKRFRDQKRGRPLKMIAAAGPYTLSDNLLFEPFAELMSHVHKERPDMGPFVSSQHQLIASGDVDMTPEQYFSTFISSKLAQYERQYPKEMRILLVPSLQDIIHEIAVLPQPAFSLPPTKTNPRPDFTAPLGLPPGTLCFSNPAQFKINETVIAVNTADILMHLSGDEIARNPLQTDRMGRLSKYLIDQRNMHPVYPGLTQAVESGVDFRHFNKMDLHVCPDILILPSKLKGFAKAVDNIVIVNPNQLSKGQSGGTFARFTIHPFAQDVLDDSVEMMKEGIEGSESMEHRLHKRCRVDLLRV
ncbi:DNA-directed DNA polymerase alpha subunit pol12 [Mortierella sp. NVP85]|nr:DNA-directed DNA polymerase alpha subunit pol12 [Mortierella sp. NVP85]